MFCCTRWQLYHIGAMDPGRGLCAYTTSVCIVHDNAVSRNLPALYFREYLATFKKTVAMHEVFLQRMAAHPVLRSDVNFKVFLEYEPEVLSLF